MLTPLALAALAVALGFALLWWRERRLAARERRERAWLSDAMEATPCSFAIYAPDRTLLACNQAYRDLHREAFAAARPPVRFEDLARASCDPSLPPAAVEAEVARLVADHEACVGQGFDRLLPGGRWMRVQKSRVAGGAVAGFAIDITGLKAREAGLAASEARLRAMVDDAPVGIWQLDAAGRTAFANPTLTSLLGLDAPPPTLAAVGLDPPADAPPEHPFGFVPGARTERRLPDARDGERTLLIVASHWLTDAAGEASAVLTVLDITPLKRAQSQLERLARQDPLTGLGNREAFRAARDALCARGGALILLDLDHFKEANDRHGHEAGDALLVAIAQRLRAALRPDDLVARLGGDEFALVVPGATAEAAEAIAARAGQLVRQPVAFRGAELRVGASVGIALAPVDGQDGETLNRAADLALYAAKSQRQERPLRFEAELATRAEQRLRLHEAVRAALADREFRLAFQPQRRLPAGELVGAEALLRWDSTALGRPVPPEELMAAAHGARLLPALDAWALEQAVAALAGWGARPDAPPVLAVNLNPASLADPQLADRLARLLLEARVPAARLELDLPAAVVAGLSVASADTIARLAAVGVRLALDGFGAGPCELRRLAALPLARVKLDPALTQSLDSADPPRAALRGALALARSLGVEVMAVGVETEAQAFALRREGVALVQGGLSGAPVAPDALLDDAAPPEGRALAR